MHSVELYVYFNRGMRTCTIRAYVCLGSLDRAGVAKALTRWVRCTLKRYSSMHIHFPTCQVSPQVHPMMVSPVKNTEE